MSTARYKNSSKKVDTLKKGMGKAEERLLSIASGSKDETIQLWDVQNCSRWRSLKSDRLDECMDISGISGLTNAEKASLKMLCATE